MKKHNQKTNSTSGSNKPGSLEVKQRNTTTSPAAPPPIIPPPPVNPSITPTQNITQASTNYISNPFSVVIRGFSNVFKYNPIPIIILIVASVTLNFIFNFYQYFIPKNTISSFRESGIIIGVSIGILALSVAVSLIISSISLLVGIQSTKGRSHTFGEFFHYFLSLIGKLLGLNIFMVIIIMLGLVFFIVPGILFMYWYCLAPLVVIDQNKNIGEAMTISKRMMKNKFWEWLGLMIVMTIFGLSGILMPVTYGGGMGQFYQQIKNLEDTNSTKPPTHWSNYLTAGIILLIITLSLTTTIFLFMLLALF